MLRFWLPDGIPNRREALWLVKPPVPYANYPRLRWGRKSAILNAQRRPDANLAGATWHNRHGTATMPKLILPKLSGIVPAAALNQQGHKAMTVITMPGVKLPPEPPAELPCIEPAPAPEFFCNDLARINVHGSFTRLIFTAPERVIEGEGPDQNIVVLKVVIPTEALRAFYEAIGKKLAAASPANGEAG